MTTRSPAKKDPKVRDDGVCARRGCTKKVLKAPPKTMPKHLRPMYLSAIKQDPFCSAVCCREHHKTTEKTSAVTTFEPPERVTQFYDHTVKRREYRDKNKVPCENGCGNLAEGKGRSTKPGQNPDRPHLCRPCSRTNQHTKAA